MTDPEAARLAALSNPRRIRQEIRASLGLADRLRRLLDQARARLCGPELAGGTLPRCSECPIAWAGPHVLCQLCERRQELPQ